MKIRRVLVPVLYLRVEGLRFAIHATIGHRSGGRGKKPRKCIWQDGFKLALAKCSKLLYLQYSLLLCIQKSVVEYYSHNTHYSCNDRGIGELYTETGRRCWEVVVQMGTCIQ